MAIDQVYAPAMSDEVVARAAGESILIAQLMRVFECLIMTPNGHRMETD